MARLAVSVILFCLLLPALALGAAEEATDAGLADLSQRLAERPTLADLVAYAYRVSPLVQAARAEWRATVEQYRVDTALDDPEVMLEGMYMPSMYTDPFNPDDWQVTLTQALPLPGRLAQAGKVAATEAGLARLRLDSAVRDTTIRIRETCQELLYLREARRLAEANSQQLDQVQKVGASSASSRTALIDVLKAQAQAGQLRYDALLLQESERTEQTRLNAILNRAPDAPIGVLEDLPMRPVVYSLAELFTLAETNLEEVKMARASVSKAEAMLDLTRYETWPQLKLAVSYGDVDQDQQVGVQAGFSLPLWYGKNQGRLGVARAEIDKTRAQQNLQVNESRAALRDLYFRLQNSERLVTLYRDDLIPQSQRAMQTAETWVSQGQGSFSDYVETTSAWYNFHLALARAKADYGKFLARLEGLAGRSLTERGPALPQQEAGAGEAAGAGDGAEAGQ